MFIPLQLYNVNTYINHDLKFPTKEIIHKIKGNGEGEKNEKNHAIQFEYVTW